MRSLLERRPQLAKIVKQLIERSAELDPWLEFPQSGCPFLFGELKRPLPIGALHVLWQNDPRWRQICPSCGGDARGILCGGWLSTGYFEFICLGCDLRFINGSGGLGAAFGLLKSLNDTEFKVSSGCFGGAYGSTGEALLRVLGFSFSTTESARFSIAAGPRTRSKQKRYKPTKK